MALPKSHVELLPDEDDVNDEPIPEDPVGGGGGGESVADAPNAEDEKEVLWRRRMGRLPTQAEKKREREEAKKARKAVSTLFAPEADVDMVSSQSETEKSDAEIMKGRPVDAAVSSSEDEASKPLHQIVVPPYSSEDEMADVEIVSFNEDENKKRKKKKKKKPQRKGPVIGPVFENCDIGLPPGEYIDITPLEPLLKHGRIERGVMKKVLRPGSGPFPKAGTIIQVEHHQLGFLQADKRIFMDTTKTFMEPENAKPEKWVFGSGQQIPGLEAGIFTMRPGEKARFRLDWRYAYGERGISPGPPFIPPCADIFLDVTMFSWKPCAKERCAMNSAEMFEEAKRVKDEAAYAFKAGKWAEANFILDDVFTCIKLMFHEFIQTEWNAVRQLEGEALNNQAMCYIRMGDYEMVERRARKCLEILQEDVRCLYRLGLACNEQKKYEEAKKYLKYALCIKPDSLTIRDEYNRACKNIRDELFAVKKTWKGAFQRPNKLGDKEEVAKIKENAELNAKLAEYERKKKERVEALQNKRASNPKTQLGKGTVLTPEQVAARFGKLKKKKSVRDAAVPVENPAVVDGPSKLEALATLSHNTLAELGGPPMRGRSKAEEAFERSVLGTRGGDGGGRGPEYGRRPVEVDDTELSRYQAGEERFAAVRQRRERAQFEREEGEAKARLEEERQRRK